MHALGDALLKQNSKRVILLSNLSLFEFLLFIILILTRPFKTVKKP